MPGQTVQILSDFLRFTFIYNEGGTFGIIIGDYRIYIVLSLMAIVIVVAYFIKSASQPLIARICLALVIGGAIGNLIDRVAFGQVIDFIDVDIFDINVPPFNIGFIRFPGLWLSRWYTFNVADAAITVGLIGLAIFLLFFSESARSRQSAENPAIAKNEFSDTEAHGS